MAEHGSGLGELVRAMGHEPEHPMVFAALEHEHPDTIGHTAKVYSAFQSGDIHELDNALHAWHDARQEMLDAEDEHEREANLSQGRHESPRR